MKYSIKKNLLVYTIGLILGIIIIILLALNSDSSEYITNSLIGLANFLYYLNLYSKWTFFSCSIIRFWASCDSKKIYQGK